MDSTQKLHTHQQVVFEVQLKLIDGTCETRQELEKAVAVLDRQRLVEVAEERAIQGRCGMPTCGHVAKCVGLDFAETLQQRVIWRGRIIDASIMYEFCSGLCYDRFNKILEAGNVMWNADDLLGPPVDTSPILVQDNENPSSEQHQAKPSIVKPVLERRVPEPSVLKSSPVSSSSQVQSCAPIRRKPVSAARAAALAAVAQASRPSPSPTNGPNASDKLPSLGNATPSQASVSEPKPVTSNSNFAISESKSSEKPIPQPAIKSSSQKSRRNHPNERRHVSFASEESKDSRSHNNDSLPENEEEDHDNELDFGSEEVVLFFREEAEDEDDHYEDENDKDGQDEDGEKEELQENEGQEQDQDLIGFLDLSFSGMMVDELSPFAVAWDMLTRWITPETKQFVQGRSLPTETPSNPTNSQEEENCQKLVSARKSDLEKAFITALRSMVNLDQPLDNANFAELFTNLHLLCLTFDLSRPIPDLSPTHWQLLSFIVIEALRKFNSQQQRQEEFLPKIKCSDDLPLFAGRIGDHRTQILLGLFEQ